jgi:hypothetical protein
MYMNTCSSLLFAVLCSLHADVGHAQDGGPVHLSRSRPRYQLSFGAEPGPLLELGHGSVAGEHEATAGWRLGGMVRPARHGVLTASYSFHQSRGHVQFIDSVVHVPGHWDGIPFFLQWWVEPYDQVYGDQVTLDQDVHSYEVSGGYTLPARWPRKRVFVTCTALTGVRCLSVKEQHTYSFNISAPEQSVHLETSALGWTWMFRLRADLHITKFASVYTEVISSQPLGELHLNSSATWNGETRTLKSTRRANTEMFMGFGVALHL